jgi:hypothetical protein
MHHENRRRSNFIALGDLHANLAKIGDFSSRAQKTGAELIVFPEMVDTGYSSSCNSLDELSCARTSEDCQRSLDRDHQWRFGTEGRLDLQFSSRDIDGKAFSRASGSARVNPKCSTAQTRRIKAGIKGTKAREE